MAVGRGKVMQDFDSELIPAEGHIPQVVKGPSAGIDSGSKDCVNLPLPTAVFRFKWLFLFFIPVMDHALPGFYLPWGKDTDLKYEATTTPAPCPEHSFAVRVAEKIIDFHQQVLSPVDGPRSHFRPSSSSYMREAMQKHGFIQGFFMGCDRLMRENEDPWVYRKIETEGKLFKYDPVR